MLRILFSGILQFFHLVMLLFFSFFFLVFSFSLFFDFYKNQAATSSLWKKCGNEKKISDFFFCCRILLSFNLAAVAFDFRIFHIALVSAGIELKSFLCRKKGFRLFVQSIQLVSFLWQSVCIERSKQGGMSEESCSMRLSLCPHCAASRIERNF